jgi:hypothetical protein
VSGRRVALDGFVRHLRGQHARSGFPTRFSHGWLLRVGPSRALVIFCRWGAADVGGVRADADAWPDVAITDASHSYEAMAVVGPMAGDVAAAANDCRAVTILRSSEIEFLLVVAKPEAAMLWRALLQAGVACGAHPVSASSIALLAAARKVVDCQRRASERGLPTCSDRQAAEDAAEKTRRARPPRSQPRRIG